ncbi:hypothetical protein QBC34DRAFT_475382 [Podospora aff. communis PSN243]|uniref:Uncharacterized protein n=1 Tax=Podospora aff. communis PSN243 TaxID=3040156 RepID=A0AAV9G9P9_9PEZI|nr:hypothetical protein QBC34DRAFT_475382 [Podospora aff. communis PSN243]
MEKVTSPIERLAELGGRLANIFFGRHHSEDSVTSKPVLKLSDHRDEFGLAFHTLSQEARSGRQSSATRNILGEVFGVSFFPAKTDAAAEGGASTNRLDNFPSIKAHFPLWATKHGRLVRAPKSGKVELKVPVCHVPLAQVEHGISDTLPPADGILPQETTPTGQTHPDSKQHTEPGILGFNYCDVLDEYLPVTDAHEPFDFIYCPVLQEYLPIDKSQEIVDTTFSQEVGHPINTDIPVQEADTATSLVKFDDKTGSRGMALSRKSKISPLKLDKTNQVEREALPTTICDQSLEAVKIFPMPDAQYFDLAWALGNDGAIHLVTSSDEHIRALSGAEMACFEEWYPTWRTDDVVLPSVPCPEKTQTAAPIAEVKRIEAEERLLLECTEYEDKLHETKLPEGHSKPEEEALMNLDEEDEDVWFEENFLQWSKPKLLLEGPSESEEKAHLAFIAAEDEAWYEETLEEEQKLLEGPPQAEEQALVAFIDAEDQAWYEETLQKEQKLLEGPPQAEEQALVAFIAAEDQMWYEETLEEEQKLLEYYHEDNNSSTPNSAANSDHESDNSLGNLVQSSRRLQRCTWHLFTREGLVTHSWAGPKIMVTTPDGTTLWPHDLRRYHDAGLLLEAATTYEDSESEISEEE